jgi:hypothetical protein
VLRLLIIYGLDEGHRKKISGKCFHKFIIHVVCLVRKDMDVNENGRLFNITLGQIHIKKRNFTSLVAGT